MLCPVMLDPPIAMSASSPDMEPASPLDPLMPIPASTCSAASSSSEGDSRQPTNVDFHDPQTDTVYVGKTQPLRVRKRSVHRDRIVGLGPASRHRRAELSVPSSPLSSRQPSLFSRSIHSLHSRQSSSPTSSLFPTQLSLSPLLRRNTADSLHPSAHRSEAHQIISHILFTTPPMSPFLVSPNAPPTTKKRAPSLHSDFHLGLGRFESSDGLLTPGPSPPESAVPSPVRNVFGNVHQAPTQSSLPTAPAMPMTPDRAPRKAAELLGAAKTASHATRPKRKVEHYRPLPSHVKVELDRLLGNVQKKSAKPIPSGVKPTANTKAQSQAHTTGASKSKSIESTGEIGGGETVRHRGEDGTMWLDVEEEQEFAWLMADVLSLLPASLPHPKTGADEGVCEETGDAEDLWGMKTFTSVLDIATIKRAQKGTSGAVGKKGRHMGDSFFEMDTPRPTRTLKAKLDWESRESYPWSNPASKRPTVKAELKSSISASPPQSLPMVRAGSPGLSETPLSIPGLTAESRPSVPQPKGAKHRPTPLALAPPKPSSRPSFDVDASYDPAASYPFSSTLMMRSNSDQPRSASLRVRTPFVHPRPAPKASEVFQSTSSPAAASVSNRAAREDFSVFEPPTPTVMHRRSASGGHAVSVTNDKGSKGGWFKRMGKAVAGGVRL